MIDTPMAVSDNVSEGRGNRGVHTCNLACVSHSTMIHWQEVLVWSSLGVRISDACQA